MIAFTKQRFKDWVTIPLIGSVVIALIFERVALGEGDIPEVLETVFFSFCYWSILANGNSYLIDRIDERWSWLEAPVKRTIIGVVVLVLFTFVAATVILFLQIKFYFRISFVDVLVYQGWTLYAIPFGITLVMALWGHGKAFLFEWRDAATKVERLKTEGLKSKFESLRNQVNPHFLFNSLNALSSLVYDDQKKAVDFIQKLSQVYRYVLDHQNDEVVALEDELKFLESFVYLNKIRFGDNFNVSLVNLEYLPKNTVIPPVALQMLIENCIKHNEISKDRKLNITVEKVGDEIMVSNNINSIELNKKESSGLGLSNIQMRYEMLTDQKVKIDESGQTFVVSVPLLIMES